MTVDGIRRLALGGAVPFSDGGVVTTALLSNEPATVAQADGESADDPDVTLEAVSTFLRLADMGASTAMSAVGQTGRTDAVVLASPVAATSTPKAVSQTVAATSVPPTATSVPPTATSAPPAATSVPPTATSAPATAVPPTQTPVVVTATPLPGDSDADCRDGDARVDPPRDANPDARRSRS